VNNPGSKYLNWWLSSIKSDCSMKCVYRLIRSHSSFVWHTMQIFSSPNWSWLSSGKCCHVSWRWNCCICRSV